MPRAFLRSQLSIWRRQQDWPFEPSGYYFLARAAQILCPDANEGLQQKAAAPMRRQLADGELRAAALLGNGTLAPVPPDAWVVDENFSQWFSACQITNFALFGSGIHPLAGVTHHWLFIQKAGLDANLARPEQSGRSTVAGREGFKRWLVDLMLASPNQKTISRDQQIAVGTGEHKLSARDAAGVRDRALSEVPEAVRKAWSKSGPTASSVSS